MGQLEVGGTQPKGLLPRYKRAGSSLSLRTVVARACGSRSGANARSRCRYASVVLIDGNGAGQMCFGRKIKLLGLEDHKRTSKTPYRAA
jgi:hypothetical protein